MSLPCCTAFKGMFTATAPDVCKTPTVAGPVPIPYPNMGDLANINLDTASTCVFIAGSAAAMETSQLLMTQGDDAGVLGGIISEEVMGPAELTDGSTVVIIEGRGAGYTGCLTGHNGEGEFNTIGLHDVPSQDTVFVAP